MLFVADFFFVVIIVSLLMNVTANRLPEHIAVPFVRWGWFCVLLYFTMRALSIEVIQKGVLMFASTRLASYCLAGFIGALVGVIYWGAINSATARLVRSEKAKVVIPVYPRFRSIHASHQELGDPRKSEEMLDVVYFGAYENAIVIWIKRTNTDFTLDQHGNWKAISRPDMQIDKTKEGNLRWYSDTCNRAKLHIPEDVLPPWGGLAMLWDQDLKKGTNDVKWVGGRSWHCEYRDVVYRQEFDNGFVIGWLRTTILPSSTDGQTLAFIKDHPDSGKWYSEISTVDALPPYVELSPGDEIPCQ